MTAVNPMNSKRCGSARAKFQLALSCLILAAVSVPVGAAYARKRSRSPGYDEVIGYFTIKPHWRPGRFRVVNPEGTAVAGAQVLIGSSLHHPFRNNFLIADRDGQVSIPSAWTEPDTVSLFAPGFVRSTYESVDPDGLVSLVLNASTQLSERPARLVLVNQELGVKQQAQWLSSRPPVAPPAQLAALATVSQLSEKAPHGGTWRKVWDVFASGWHSRLQLPKWPSSESADGPRKWEVSYLGTTERVIAPSVGPQVFKQATHAIHDSTEF